MNVIAPTAKLLGNVRLGQNIKIGDYVVIGELPRSQENGATETLIGDGATIRSHTVIYAGNKIGKNFQTGHGVLIREDNRIGDNVSVGSGSVIEHHVVVEDHVRIHSQAFVPEYTVLKKGCWIGPGVVLTNAVYPLSPDAKENLQGPIIQEGAKIGGNASVLPGVTVGTGALIGAGAVVVKNISEGKVVVGNPAHEINSIENLSAYATEKKRIPLIDLKAQIRSIGTEIDQAIRRVIDKGAFILGEEVESFEKEFSSYVGTKYSVGVSSGTAAVHLALLALGVKPGDEVITTPFSFIATPEAILHAGAAPVFVDIDSETLCINPSLIAKAITRKTKAIVVVHIHGHPASMDPIMKIAKQHKLGVVEDAAQAHGALYQGQMVGSIGDVGCFSFFPAKNLGAFGDAGAVVTNRSDIASKVALLRDHGRKKKYEHEIAGFNHRIDALQAAVLRAKLPYLNDWNKRRRTIAATYIQKLKDVVKTPVQKPESVSAYHLFVVRTPRQTELQKWLASKGIDTGIHYPIPLHLQPALKFLGYKRGEFPVTEQASKQVLSIPLYAEMTDETVEEVINQIRTYFKPKRK